MGVTCIPRWVARQWLSSRVRRVYGVLRKHKHMIDFVVWDYHFGIAAESHNFRVSPMCEHDGEMWGRGGGAGV